MRQSPSGGYPDAERSVVGAKQYDWVRSYQTVGTYGDSGQHTFICMRTLTLSQGRVVDAKASGNNCPFDLLEVRPTLKLPAHD